MGGHGGTSWSFIIASNVGTTHTRECAGEGNNLNTEGIRVWDVNVTASDAETQILIYSTNEAIRSTQTMANENPRTTLVPTTTVTSGKVGK
jgi:hypothetical protein